SRFMMAESPDTKFGELNETSLSGYIEAIDMGIRHLAAIEQIPPHHLLGQIANLSAEALNAAETALMRKIEEFQHSFGESWERTFRLIGELEGNQAQASDYHAEVVWRDMGAQSLAQTSDALGKLSEMLGVPKRGLWRRVPGVTQRELEEWTDLLEEEPDRALAAGNVRALGPRETPAEPAGAACDGAVGRRGPAGLGPPAPPGRGGRARPQPSARAGKPCPRRNRAHGRGLPDMPTPAHLREAEEASAAFQLALAQIGVETVAEALELWESVNPARLAATAERWLNQAIQLILTRRRQSRDLAMAYYRLVRALRTGSTVADPTLPSPRYVTLEVLRNEFRELVGDAESDLPDGPLPEGDGIDIDEERIPVE